MALPTDAKQRKDVPIYSGVLQYFPNALAAVAACSKAGNDQHNPGKPLHWDRSKSGDELDALTRHLMEAGTVDTDGIRHSAKVAWRALANLEKELEAERALTDGQYDPKIDKDYRVPEVTLDQANISLAAVQQESWAHPLDRTACWMHKDAVIPRSRD